MSGQAEERVLLGLGGNLGDPAQAMGEALRLLDHGPDTRVTAVSPLYRTPPWGKTDQPDFLNAAAELRTRLSPHELLELCLDVEHRLKRVRKERWGPRLIDIDVLLFGDWRVQEPGLEIPHPRLLERAFVLVPLAAIAPDFVIDDRTIAEHASSAEKAGIEEVPSGRDWWKAQF